MSLAETFAFARAAPWSTVQTRDCASKVRDTWRRSIRIVPPIACTFLAQASTSCPGRGADSGRIRSASWRQRLLLPAERAAQPIDDGGAEAQALDALGGPIGRDVVAAHAPHLFGVGLEEDRKEPLTELLRTH